ncbi:hypothetical protein BH09VER1_BH09VER1_43680 [soil metagenome]
MDSTTAPISEEQNLYLRRLQAAVHSAHGCGALHVCTNMVSVMLSGGRWWSGEVETFQLIGHPEAQRCFAWGFYEGRRFRAHAVPDLGSIDSPSGAVMSIISIRPARRR